MPGSSPLFRFFEQQVNPTAAHAATPPAGLGAFFWHFVRQTKGLFVAMFATGLVVALIDTSIPVFIGRLVGLMEAPDRASALREAMPALAGMAAIVLIGRPLRPAGNPFRPARRSVRRDGARGRAQYLAQVRREDAGGSFCRRPAGSSTKFDYA